jgi:cupredoxin-like protein
VRQEDFMSSRHLAIMLALVASAAACGGGDTSTPITPTTPSAAPPPVTAGVSSSITIPSGAEFLGNRAFSPADLTIDAGTTVTWTNTDRTSHTSTSNATGWNSGTIAPGGQFSFTFAAAGTFPYHCSIHPGMTGTVVVR